MRSRFGVWKPLPIKRAQRGEDVEDEGTTEDEMAGWHHRLDGREFE